MASGKGESEKPRPRLQRESRRVSAFPLDSWHTGHSIWDRYRSFYTKPAPTVQIKQLAVAAIDFGTTYSGYAYSFRDEHIKDPLKIYTNNAGIGNTEGLVTMKVPTVVLFNKQGIFHSFGYDAENKYAELAEDEKHTGWKYFRRFKMVLHKRKIKRSTTIVDDQGSSMLAIDVFAAAIKFLKDDLLKKIQERVLDIKDSDLLWVLTVPAIWDDGAKQFMRESANKAGIPGARLKLALEPEAAAVYCKEVAVKLDRENSGESFLTSFNPGSRFMVLDLGGGTADITVHEVKMNTTPEERKTMELMELIPPSGGPWGGTVVDTAFFKFLNSLFTEAVVKKLQTDPELKIDDLELQRSFELKKRMIEISEESKETILKPPSSLFEQYQSMNKQEFSESIQQSRYANDVRKKRDKLQIKSEFLVSLFDEPVNCLLNHVKSLLRDPALKGLNTLMLVGGFSESKVLKGKIKKTFPSPAYNVIVPPDAQLAVLKGAVIYGFYPETITCRKMTHTYGISTAVPFDRTTHPQVKLVTRGGIDKCEDVFKAFISAGSTVEPGKTLVQHSFTTPFNKTTTASIEIYRTLSKYPTYVDEEGCKRVGELELALEKPSDSLCIITVTMSFGDTELKVEAQERDTNNKVSARFNFI